MAAPDYSSLTSTFFSLILGPLSSKTIKLPYTLRLSQAVLGLEKNSTKGTLYLKVNEDPRVLICRLSSAGLEAFSFELYLDVDSSVEFFNEGDASVHLTGNWTPTGVEEVDEDIDEDEDEEEEEEEVQKEESAKEKPGKKEQAKGKKADKDDKKEQQKKNTPEKSDTNNKKRKLEDLPTTSPQKKPDSSPEKKTESSPAKPKIEVKPGGLTIEDVKVGTGHVAASGKYVKVKYVGQLKNGKVFDKSTTPFGFRLGNGDVIEGWDLGVAGMKVGGKRKLVIPPKLGYGQKGAPPDIPGGATLVFDVELISVK
jgi:FK506-binding nuclear protein